MTFHAAHKRLRLVRALLTEPEFAELQRLYRVAGYPTYSAVVRHALFQQDCRRDTGDDAGET
jgi:hypothetical protein